MRQCTIMLPDTKEEAIEMADEFLDFWASLNFPRQAIALHLLYLHTLCGSKLKVETFMLEGELQFRLLEITKPTQEA